ncbi:MAG TPA: PEP-CTERM sorting domain-containing protein [Chthoniobacteraceae bacterium]|nr:PEP-CTERM sorting domain-containing protein [Chthoniobacteraceae bacterium]
MFKKTPPSFCRGLSRSFFPIACAVAFAGIAPQSALAELKSWAGGNGNWTSPGMWDKGVPGAGDDARFDNAVNSDVTVGPGEIISFDALNVRRMQVSIALGNASSFTSTGVTVGARANYAGHLIFSGPAGGSATLSLGNLVIGQPNTADGNKLTLSGSGLNATATANLSIIGRGSGSNELRVIGGAKLTLNGVRIGYIENSFGNQFAVEGAGSKVTISTDSNRSIEIGAGVGEGVNGSQMNISQGGVVSSTVSMKISQMAGTHSNSVTVSGAGSKLEMTSAAALTIGVSSTPTGAGGSFVRLTDGGKLTTDGNVTIHGHDITSTLEHGSNALLIEDGSTLTQTAGALTIGKNALLRLESGATLTSPGVQVAGRFEAEGNGLQATPVTIAEGAVLAIGVEGRTAAQQLNITQSMTLEAGSFLEVKLFASGEMDQLALNPGASLVLGSGVTLRLSLAGYEPVLNDSWTLVDGATGGVSGDFELFEMPELQGGLSWDLSNLNEAGGWRVAVIPEPGTWLLTGLGGLALLALRQRRSKSLAADR